MRSIPFASGLMVELEHVLEVLLGHPDQPVPAVVELSPLWMRTTPSTSQPPMSGVHATADARAELLALAERQFVHPVELEGVVRAAGAGDVEPVLTQRALRPGLAPERVAVAALDEQALAHPPPQFDLHRVEPGVAAVVSRYALPCATAGFGMKKLIGSPAAMRLASSPVPVPIPFCSPLVPVPAIAVTPSWSARCTGTSRGCCTRTTPGSSRACSWPGSCSRASSSGVPAKYAWKIGSGEVPGAPV